VLEIVEQGTSGDSPNMGHVLQKTKASPRFHPCFSLTVVDNQSPPIISAIIDLLFLLLELMRTSHARFVAKFQ